MQSDANQTWVLTSHRLVAGAAARKRPVTVRLGIAERQAEVFSTDPNNDLALLILKVGGQPVLSWLERGAPSPGAGTDVWAVGTAPGRLGAAALKVRLIDSSPQSLLIDTDPGLQASGGPLLDKEGKVLGVLSSTYAPVGFPAFGRWVVPVRVSCLKVVRCPD
ncbi:MAG: trypsin-like peptidase domain-containing protein [Actinomycetota bacterium]